jgi:hypothetical protein
MLAKTSTLACVVLGTMFPVHLATAQAQPVVAPNGAGSAADATYQLTLPPGRLLLEAFAEMNLSSGAVFKPFSLAPDVWYGATPELTVGLVHSGRAATGFIGTFGDSLCLTGVENGCPDVYHNVGLAARYQLPRSPGAFVWAIDGGLYASNLDPFALAIKLGVVSRWQQSEKLVVELSPSLFLGVTERDNVLNKETLYIPATAAYTVAPQTAVALQLGFVLPIEDIAEAYAIPLSIGAHREINESLTLHLTFSLPRLIAGSPDEVMGMPAPGTLPDGLDVRTLTLGGSYAF